MRLTWLPTKFTEEPTIPDNVACYACQLGDHARAKELLALAYERGNAEEIKLMGLDDPDLASLWKSLPNHTSDRSPLEGHVSNAQRLARSSCWC